MEDRRGQIDHEKMKLYDAREQEELKKETLKRLRDAILALEQWKKDSLASQFRY